MIERRNLRQLFDAILAFDYIEKITEGRYKNLVYQSHGWYYCNYDEDGKVIDRTVDPFMLCLSVDQVDTYKSTLNTNALILIYDEFISRRYYQDEFIWFCDIISTCFRRPEQDEGFIFMLANTIDREHQYFYEMELNDAIHKLPIGASTEIITSGGTPIYLELYTRGQTPEKTRHNRLFYGFKNKKLGSITGIAGHVFAFDDFSGSKHGRAGAKRTQDLSDPLCQCHCGSSPFAISRSFR